MEAYRPPVGLSRRDGRIIRLYVTERPAAEPKTRIGLVPPGSLLEVFSHPVRHGERHRIEQRHGEMLALPYLSLGRQL